MNRSIRGHAEARRSADRIKTVASNLRRLAAKHDMPMAHLADHAGIGRTTMWRILDANDRGASDPRLGTIEALADALDVDVVDLLRPPAEAKT